MAVYGMHVNLDQELFIKAQLLWACTPDPDIDESGIIVGTKILCLQKSNLIRLNRSHACLKVHKASGWNRCNWQPSYFLLLHQMLSKPQEEPLEHTICKETKLRSLRCLNL